MKQIRLQWIFLSLTLASTSLFVSNINSSFAQSESEESECSNVVRDSTVVLLEGKALGANDFIHLYDSTPYMIMNGHVAAKLPCDDNSESPVKVLIGSAPNLSTADLELVSDLSSPGVSCLYHADLQSTPEGNASSIVTDIAIQNPTGDQISFGSTDSVVIGINEIMKGAHEEGHDVHGGTDEDAEGETDEHSENAEGQAEDASDTPEDTS